MAKAVIGMFDKNAHAEEVVRELQSVGFSGDDLQIVVNRPDLETGPALGGPLEDMGTESGLGAGTATASSTHRAGIIRALRSMGVPEEQAEEYAEGVSRGAALVIARSSDERADAAADLMDHHNALRVEERAAEWSAAGWKRRFARAGEDRGLSPRRRTADTVQVGRDRTEAGGARIFVW
ncbi:MAG TPA: hypothetical protein VHA11_07545 [Bryobacteraceae bacterium]|nr:hypothetical protein [Bryobacteraceae bacterium]